MTFRALLVSLFGSLLATAACGDSGTPAADTTTGGSDSTGTDAGSSGSEESTTGGPDLWPYDHGYVKVNFVVSPEAADPAVIDLTDTVVIAMDYGECLTAYYEGNPTVQQFGTLGPAIFGDSSMGGAGWEDLLCSPLFGDHAACTIVWITQRFDVVKSLTITYDVMSDLGTKPLFFGPLPTPAVAECADGLTPSVQVPGAMSFRGIDAAGADLWTAESWAPDQAASRDEDPITVTILPVEAG